MPKVITIDGPSGVGKGTLSRKLASELHFDYLDSGAIYRALACFAKQREVAFDDEVLLAQLAHDLPLSFENQGRSYEVFLGSLRITDLIRQESVGLSASQISAYPKVRSALLDRQRQFSTKKGLVADGRDMGTVVFPQAELKIFLTASAEVRAARRRDQLQQAGEHVSFETILKEIEARDLRDRNRSVSPLKPASDAIEIDTSELSAQAVFDRVWVLVQTVFFQK